MALNLHRLWQEAHLQPYNVRCMKCASRVLQVSRRAQEGWEEQCNGPWSISGCRRPRSSADLWQILSSPRRRTPPGCDSPATCDEVFSRTTVGFKQAQAACDNARRALLVIGYRVGAADGAVADGRTPRRKTIFSRSARHVENSHTLSPSCHCTYSCNPGYKECLQSVGEL